MSNPIKSESLLNDQMEMNEDLADDIADLSSDKESIINIDLETSPENEELIREQYFWLYRNALIDTLKTYSSNELEIKASVLGLWKAAHNYDHQRGYRFLTYAVHWIEASIQNKDQLSMELIEEIYNKRDYTAG